MNILSDKLIGFTAYLFVTIPPPSIPSDWISALFQYGLPTVLLVLLAWHTTRERDKDRKERAKDKEMDLNERQKERDIMERHLQASQKTNEELQAWMRGIIDNLNKK